MSPRARIVFALAPFAAFALFACSAAEAGWFYRAPACSGPNCSRPVQAPSRTVVSHAVPTKAVATPQRAQPVARSGAQQAEPELKGDVDSAAVVRRGPAVERVAGGIEQSREQSIESLVRQTIEEVPADDRDKFFCTLITIPGCEPCERLVAAWPSSHLAHIALMDPAKASESWAHFNRYNAGDASQMERFQSIGAKDLPVLLIQAPLSGKFGKPGKVIYQHDGFDGNADAIAAEALASVRAYIETVAPQLLHEQDAARFAGLPEASPLSTPKIPSGAIMQSNRLPPVPFDPNARESLLPRFDEPVEIPPRELVRARQAGGLFSTISSLWSECNGACGGWLPYVLAAIGLLQQWLVRKYPNPDDPSTPPLVRLALELLGPLTALTSRTIGPKPRKAPAIPAAT